MLKFLQALLALTFPPFGFTYVWYLGSKGTEIKALGHWVAPEEDDDPSNPMRMPAENIFGYALCEF